MIDVILLVGGMATRLRSITEDKIPKCMVDVNGAPFIKYQLDLLESQLGGQIYNVILATGRLSEQIKDYINMVQMYYTFDIKSSNEDHPLGTGGAMKLALQKTVCDSVLVMNGDVYNQIDYKDFIKSSRPVTIALTQMFKSDRYGVVSVDDHGNMRTWEPKRYIDWGLINRGIYLFRFKNNPFDEFPDEFSFESDFIPRYMKSSQIYTRNMDGYFIDIGIPEDYNAFCNWVKTPEYKGMVK